jgi:hypothetical protein
MFVDLFFYLFISVIKIGAENFFIKYRNEIEKPTIIGYLAILFKS